MESLNQSQTFIQFSASAEYSKFMKYFFKMQKTFLETIFNSILKEFFLELHVENMCVAVILC